MDETPKLLFMVRVDASRRKTLLSFWDSVAMGLNCRRHINDHEGREQERKPGLRRTNIPDTEPKKP